MNTHRQGDDHAPYYRIRRDATGETVADHRDHPATGRDHTSATTDKRDHDQADATSDQEETMATTRTAKPKTATKKPTATGRTTTRRGAEISIGLLLLTIGAGVGAYYLAYGLLGWPRDVALVTSGLVGGLLSSSVLGPLWQHARATMGDWIHPGKASR